MKSCKKIISISILFCMLFMLTANVFAATSQNPPTPGYTGYAMVTADPYLNVRSGPGSSYGKIGEVLYGEWVNVVKVSAGWAKIENFDTGSYGYVSTEYLQKVN